MPSCAAIRHIHFEDLGTFEEPLRARGYSIRYIEAGYDDPMAAAEADLAVVLGGPIDATGEDKYPFVLDEMRLVEARLAAGRPLLGICLGAQMIARAAGGRVYPGAAGKEIGWAPLEWTPPTPAGPLAPLAEDGAMMFHWHGDTFDLPPGGVRLASSEKYANQVFTLGSALAFQCHPELDASGLERWLLGHACELAAPGLPHPAALREGAASYGESLRRRGRAAFGGWLDGLSAG
ncbi:MAG: glutamine amidotransferase [Candidatus Sumerlaeia bacterium]|nr:glutamine amidotransferase [Candidatus Sumerlaeia bacterium]